MSGRGGIDNRLYVEALEVLLGRRGDKNKSALLRGDITNLDQLIASAQQELKRLETRLDNSSDDLDLEIANINNAISDIQLNITGLNSDMTSAEDNITNIFLSLTGIENDVSSLQQGPASLPVTADLNTAVRNIFFQWSNTSTNTPVAASYGRGVTIPSSSNDLTQIGIINATGQMFVRYRTGGAWGAWADIVSLRAEPFALQSNPGATPFPSGVFTAIPFLTNTELSGGITKTGNSTFTVPVAGLYQFELEVRMNGGAANMPPVGTAIGISIDTTTVPTGLRAGFSAGVAVSALTVLRLTCTERLAAGAQRVPYILNQGAAAYQVVSATIKIARLSA